jgi:DNA-binding beta-propeller fold protein YncE
VGVTAFELVDPYDTWPKWDWLYPSTDQPHKQYTVVKGLPKPEPLEVYPSRLTISFRAEVAGVPGTYRSDVRAVAEGVTISPLLGTAPVIVVEELHTRSLPLGARAGAAPLTAPEAASASEWEVGLQELLDELDPSLMETAPPAEGSLTYLGAPSGDAVPPEIGERVEVGSDPQGVTLDPQRNRAYVTLSDGSLVAVDTSSYRVVCSVEVGSGPQGVAADGLAGLVYVANRDAGTLSVVDGMGCGVVATLDGFETPGDVAVDSHAGRVYVSDCAAGQAVVLDAQSRAVVARLPVGSCPETLALDEASRLLYVGNSGDGTVSVIALDSLETGATVRGSQGPVLGLAAASGTGQAYVVGVDSPPRRRLAVVDGSTGEVTASLAGGWDRPLSDTYAVAVDGEGGRLYLADGRELLVIHAEDLTLEWAIPVEAVTYEYGLAVDPLTGRLYVLDGAEGALLVLEH